MHNNYFSSLLSALQQRSIQSSLIEFTLTSKLLHGHVFLCFCVQSPRVLLVIMVSTGTFFVLNLSEVKVHSPTASHCQEEEMEKQKSKTIWERESIYNSSAGLQMAAIF